MSDLNGLSSCAGRLTKLVSISGFPVTQVKNPSTFPPPPPKSFSLIYIYNITIILQYTYTEPILPSPNCMQTNHVYYHDHDQSC